MDNPDKYRVFTEAAVSLLENAHGIMDNLSPRAKCKRLVRKLQNDQVHIRCFGVAVGSDQRTGAADFPGSIDQYGVVGGQPWACFWALRRYG